MQKNDENPPLDPLHQLANQIGEILQMVNKSKEKISNTPLSPDLKEKIEKLKKGMEAFKQLHMAMFEKAKIQPEELRRNLQLPNAIDKGVYDLLRKMFVDALVIKAKLRRIEMSKRPKLPPGSKKKQKTGPKTSLVQQRARKKRFSRLRKKGWV